MIIVGKICFNSLAPKWYEIMKYWNYKEKVFLKLPYEPRKGLSLAAKIRILAFIILMIAGVEDTFNFMAAYDSNILNMRNCQVKNLTFWENFMRREHPQVAYLFEYHVGWHILVELINKIMRFTWNFIDVFVICVSLAIETRYMHIYDQIKRVKNKPMARSFWKDIRCDYVSLCELLAYLDDKFGILILISCANDMYFITAQLYNSF